MEMDIVPNVEPKHQKLIDEAEQMLNNYSKDLADRLIPKQHTGLSIKPRWRIDDKIRAQRLFFEDPVRQILLSNLGMLKMLYEKPRYLLKK